VSASLRRSLDGPPNDVVDWDLSDGISDKAQDACEAGMREGAILKRRSVLEKSERRNWKSIEEAF
jgi:hypothetical protein